MPRHRRTIAQGDLVHVIGRFVDHDFRLSGSVERAEYLRRLGQSLVRTEWRLISYALMSSHIHAVFVAGRDPFEGFIKRVHTPFANWLNRYQGRRGPVFAERPKTLVVHPIWAARLIAYLHNNPARAHVVRRAEESSWTSHRAYVGLCEPPAFLAVDLGLELMGFSSSPAGRFAFSEYVAQKRDEPRDLTLTGDLRLAKRELRQALGAAVCIEHPRTGPDGLDYAVSMLAGRWEGSVAQVVESVGRARGLRPVAISSPTRNRELAAARRCVALTAAVLGRNDTEVGLHLGVSEAAIRKLRATASEDELVEARSLGAAMVAR